MSINLKFQKIRLVFRSLPLVILVTFTISCGLLDSDINQATHKTQIVVKLSGEYAKSEIASISIDGIAAGTASLNEVVTKEVEPGMHKIHALDKKGVAAWGYEKGIEIKVDTGATFTYTLTCDPARLITQIGPLCDQQGKAKMPLEAIVYDENSQKVQVQNPYFYAGDAGIALFDHGFYKVYFVDAKNTIWWDSQTPIYFQYGSSLSVNVLCE